jgi:hypothetical protein
MLAMFDQYWLMLAPAMPVKSTYVNQVKALLPMLNN